VIHVGDLVDRGPHSRQVIEHLSHGIASGQDWVVLKGNHDSLFTRFLNDPHDRDPGLRAELSWLHPKIGGATTLGSYGVPNAADRPLAPVHAEALLAVPADHRRFLETRPTWHRQGGAVFVHAGIRPGVPLERQKEADLLWIRREFLEDPRDHGALIVHGHTALAAAQHYGNRLNIDSGAAYGGPLSAVVLDEDGVFLLLDRGRVALRP
jgi:serine/threonine protein phosphatase 1